METSELKSKQFLTGLKAGIPAILGYIPVAIAYAVMARQAGFSMSETVLMSLTVFAGASQMMAVGMYAQGAGIIAIIVATFILNLRHFIMSVCVVNRMQKGNPFLKALSTLGVTDESFAIFSLEPQEKCTAMHFFGLVTGTYLSWQIGTVIGAAASELLPAILSASLGVAIYAMFIALLVPGVKQNFRLGILVVLTAAANTVLSMVMASSWSLIVSTIVCAAIGTLIVKEPETPENNNSATAEKGERL